jgi:hypothetical protein
MMDEVSSMIFHSESMRIRRYNQGGGSWPTHWVRWSCAAGMMARASKPVSRGVVQMDQGVSSKSDRISDCDDR